MDVLLHRQWANLGELPHNLGSGIRSREYRNTFETADAISRNGSLLSQPIEGKIYFGLFRFEDKEEILAE